jgi:hypothetical protein
MAGPFGPYSLRHMKTNAKRGAVMASRQNKQNITLQDRIAAWAKKRGMKPNFSRPAQSETRYSDESVRQTPPAV